MFDRGIVSEENLQAIGKGGGQYLVRTPRRQMKQFEQELLKDDWRHVRPDVKVKKVAIPRGEASPDKLLPPAVTLRLVDQTKLPKITVKVVAERGCTEQPIRSLRLLVDGRPLPNRGAMVVFEEGKEVTQHEATWGAELPPGKHKLSVLARSKDDTPSISNLIDVACPLPESERPVVHHVAVGVSPRHSVGLFAWKQRLALFHGQPARIATPAGGVWKPLLSN